MSRGPIIDDSVLQIRLPHALKEAAGEAAKNDGMNLSAWVKAAMREKLERKRP